MIAELSSREWMRRVVTGARWRRIALAQLVAVLTLLPTGGVNAAAPADLRIRVTSTAFRVGTNGTYSVSVRNEAGVDADDTVQVVTTLPAGLTFVSGRGNGWTCSGGGGTATCQTPGLRAGASTGFDLVVAACTAAYPSVTTTFRAVYDADPNLGNNVAMRVTSVKAGQCVEPTPTPTRRFGATVPPAAPTATATPAPCDLAISQRTNGRLVVGLKGSYTVRVVNLGPASTSGTVSVVVDLPRGLTFVSGTGDGWTCTHVEQQVTCVDSMPLDPRTAADLLLVVQVESTAYPTVSNRATVIYEADTVLRNNTDLQPTTVRRGRNFTRRPIRPTR